MKTMRTNSRRSSRARRGRLLGACLVAACAILLLSAASAFADVQWRITSVHGPQNMPPTGNGQYVLEAFNIGDTDGNSLGDLTIVDTLPANVTATGASGAGWDCTGTTFPATTVTCVQANGIPAAANDTNLRGVVPPLSIDVADAGASGTADNSATISLGDASSDASVTDATTFSATPAGFGFSSFASDLFDAAFPGGSSVSQAGSHPFEQRIDFTTNLKLSANPANPGTFFTEPDEHIRTIETRLPAGLIGNPEATPKCPAADVATQGPAGRGLCPPNTQVGTLDLITEDGSVIHGADSTFDISVYNMAPPKGDVAALALSYQGIPVWIDVTLDPTDYSVIATISGNTELYTIRSAELTLWGVPGDPAHDALRVDNISGQGGTIGLPLNAPMTPFLTLPSNCDEDAAVQMRADSWQHPGVFTPWQTGTPALVTGCDDHRFSFQPSITVQPESRTPSTPTGLDVDLSVPQKDDTVTDPSKLYAATGDDRAIATPPLRNARVTLPEGMSVSPSSADGLAACGPLQIGLNTNAEPACADGAKVGTVSIDTPLLPDPLTGDVYLASQGDNPFGTLLALYLVARGPGVIVKLPGKVEPDPVTGQLTATFDDNPQLPFTHLRLHFNSGPRAPLVTPPTCGTMTTTATFTSWNASLPAVDASDAFTISGDGNGAPCSARGFDPTFKAGTTSPTAGKDSPLVTRFGRSDADEELRTVDVSLPKGLLGRIASTTLCADAAADAGTCGDGSRIGTVTVGAGPGSNPFYITDGRAYITGPYKGAPYGLSIVVHAKAGPFDLGNVIVRAQVQVDRNTAALRIVSEPLPTILAGIPLLVRLVDVTVDRPGFTFNPTSCAETSSTAHLTSTGGKVSTKSSRFQVGDCAALPFKPRMSFTIGSKGHTKPGVSTPLTATVRMTKGQANLRGVSVQLPTTLNAHLGVLNHACTLAAFKAGTCTSKAKVGTAVAITPVLKDPLRGSAYFVKNPARALPDLMVALRGQVDVDLTGKVRIPGGKSLATNFDTVPDVPITTFTLHLVSGKNGPIGNVVNLCSAKGRAGRATLGFRAQSGKRVDVTQALHISGCPKPKKK